MKKALALLLVALAAGTVLAYTSLEELLKETNRAQTEALRTYLEANPDADDAAEARERLIYGLIDQDDYAAALTLLEQQYEALPADKSSLDLNVAFGEIVVPMIQVYRMEGRKDDALAFMNRVRDEFKSHEMFETIDGALEEFAGMFDAPGVGDTLDIRFTAIDDREVNLADLKGKVVLVDFWATWCMPCVKAMPEVKSLYDDFHQRGFEVIGISLDEDRERLDAYLAKENLPWPQQFDGLGWENAFALQYKVQSIPATFLIGPDGTIAAVDASGDELRELITNLLSPAPETEAP